jgi:branched-chain amino acid aminotransferase
MPKLVWFNGTVSPLETATVPAADHAHLYGDGLFEGIRFYGRKIYQFDQHLDRLYHGMAFMQFEKCMPKAEMRQTVLDVCRQADLDDGYIRLNVTRGTGLGLDPKNINRVPNVMIMVNTLALYTPEQYEVGLHVVTCAMRVMPPDSLDARLKCIGRYAANIMAKMQANRAGAGEGLLLNQQGYVAECTGDNLFLVQKGVIRTPHPSSGILQGITRDTVIELARKEGYVVTEEHLTPFDIYSADEAFLTGTAAEVIPMVSLDGHPIGCGTPGEHTRKIMALFREHTKHGVPF